MSFTADTWTLRHQFFFFNSYKCVHTFRQEPLQTEAIGGGKVFPLQPGVYKSSHRRCSVHAGPVVGGVVAYCSIGTDQNITRTSERSEPRRHLVLEYPASSSDFTHRILVSNVCGSRDIGTLLLWKPEAEKPQQKSLI